MPKLSNRRQFLKSAAAAVPMLAAGRALGQTKVSANEQITLGCIGVGTHGMGWNLEAFLRIPRARVLAVCDVFRDRQDRAREKVNGVYGNRDCAVRTDFREIL